MSADPMKIISGRGLKAYLDSVIEQGVKSTLARKAITEKERQAAASPAKDDADSLFGSDDDGPERPSKTMDDETEKLKQGDIKPKDIVEKLNSIRSGRSFKDSAVSSAMEEYIDSLAKPEKVALMAFLKGIAQIVTGEVTAQKASEPSDSPAGVHMDKSNEPSVVHKKPNVIKSVARSPKKGSTGAPVEDTTAPAPITPKRR